MSYMTQFEVQARISVAVSDLNKVRHAIRPRTAGSNPITEQDRAILEGAIEFCQTEELTRKMVLYNTRGLGEGDRFAAVQLCGALKKSIEAFSSEEFDSQIFIEKLQKVISSKQPSELDEKTREMVNELVEVTMENLASGAC